MKAKLLILSIFLITATSTVAADNVTLVEEFDENVNLTELQEGINNNQEEIPDFIATIVSGERLNLFVNGTDVQYAAELDGTEIQTLSREELDEPTLEIWINATSMEGILQSDQPIEDIQEALDEGEIEYETHTWSNSIFFFIGETIMNIGSRLGIF